MNNIVFNIPKISKIVIYCRVSSKQQADDTHTGLKTQFNICLEYIKNNDVYKDIEIAVVEEIGSSFNNQNALTKLDRLLEIIEENTLILIHDTSRFGRNIYQSNRDCERVEIKQSYIISVTEQICFGLNRITDQSFFQKLNEAEMFSNIQSERAKNRIKLLRENGEYIGRAPWGKMVIKNAENKRVLVNNQEEQDIIAELKLTLVVNGVSIYDVQRDLIQQNALNQQWPMSKLKRIIKTYMTPREQSKINYKERRVRDENYDNDDENDENQEVGRIEYNLRRRLNI